MNQFEDYNVGKGGAFMENIKKNELEGENTKKEATETLTDEETEAPDQPTEPENPETPEEPESQFEYKKIKDFYDRVRFSLNLSRNMMPDGMIDYDENAPMAEYYIKKQLPNWNELDEQKYTLFQLCIIYMTCYNLCPSASNMRISRQKDPSLEIEFTDSKTEKPCERFMSEIRSLIDEINGVETELDIGFKTTGPIHGTWPERCERASLPFFS